MAASKIICCLLLGSCSFTGWLISRASALDERHGPLQRASASPINVDASLDCSIKELAWDYAKKLLPRQGIFQSAYDALQLEACNVSLSSGKRYPSRPFQFRPQIGADAIEIFVSTSGDDGNPGTMSSPVQSISQALRLYRLRSQPVSGGMVYLRAGTFYLSETVKLGPEDSGLTITAYQGEKVTISGGRSYDFTWKEVVNKMGPIMQGVSTINDSDVAPGQSNWKAKYIGAFDSAEKCQKACMRSPTCFAFTWFNSSVEKFGKICYFRGDGLWSPVAFTGASSGKKLHIVAADISSQKPAPFTSLFLNGRRAVRARYPDGNPETMGLHTSPTGYTSVAESWLPPSFPPEADEIHIESPQRNGTHFPTFSLGLGGTVNIFRPPQSYWGTKKPDGGGGRTFMVVSGLQYSTDEGFAGRTWKRPETGVVHVFQGLHWGSWIFSLRERNSATQELHFAYGGWQEARGLFFGSEWFVENIMEELDAPGEWYFNDLDSTLYYFPNGSSSPPASGVATAVKTLFKIIGNSDTPVVNVSITNLTFSQTASTYFDYYEVPSGGDWSIHRGGALFVEGVDGFLLQNCLFDSPGGNGVFLSNYVRNAVVEGNEFVFVGDSAIAAVGTSDLIDGTSGNQPRGTRIISNLVHENGIFGKQTSPYFQSLACQTELVGNVMFNGPRAGIDFNDGFGGGNLVEGNLVFNMVRETSDHGPFNSWDRQPYLTDVRDGHTPSLTPAQSNLTRNFFINNYHSTWPIDHDDGSCYYFDTFNFLVYGGYKNYLGHSKTSKYNIYVYVDTTYNTAGGEFMSSSSCATSGGASTTVLPSGWGEVYANNTCVIGNPNVFAFSDCKLDGDNAGLLPSTSNNSFYAPGAKVVFLCQDQSLSLEQWQKLGFGAGDVVHDLPSDATIIQWGRELLGL